jgi:hypothetical protein
VKLTADLSSIAWTAPSNGESPALQRLSSSKSA